ncbi:hypothetical protein [Flavobacterium sp. AJR]|uniref:hypothetical protein n=1 Tax=Flavobacterium sp. AJR TaxID=1979369 RepID=UPI000A3D68F8|nr:hypothetical protein [Flavobacterium sp. AJR]OUL60983.1 hypothetical protein B8T70_17705 [Flavobacterium sp. AJR]
MLLHTLLRFQDFTSEINYAALQHKFASYDAKYNGILEPRFDHSIEGDFSINYKYNEDGYAELSFFDDFLYPKIDNLSKSTINIIQQKIKTTFQYDKIKIELFINDTLKECYEKESIIKKNEFLNEETRSRLSSQMAIVLEFLNDDYLKQFEFKDKFQFKLMEQDLLVLLALLRDKKKLVHHNESQLGHLIERHFECFDESTQSYKTIQKAGKKLNNFKNSYKTIQNSITRLKILLQNDSFYEM